MKNYQLNYFRFEENQISLNKKEHRFYYSGELNKGSVKKAAFSDLPHSNRLHIYNGLFHLIRLEYKGMKNGYDGNKFYAIHSENKTEVIEVKLPLMDVEPRDIFLVLDKEAFENRIMVLRKRAICILQEEHILHKKKKYY